MSELPQPKYNIGNIVWHASFISAKEDHECPDCLGKKIWFVKTPAGYETTVECLRCHGTGSLSLRSHAPLVEQRTIGSIQVNTAHYERDSAVRYMCEETGIGSGTIYNEHDLFESKETADKVSKLKAAKANEDLEARETNRADIRRIYASQLHDAEIKEAKDKQYKAERRMERLLDRICELDEFPSRGNRYEGNGFVHLEPEQVRGIQESLVWLSEEDSDYLDNWRAESEPDL